MPLPVDPSAAELPAVALLRPEQAEALVRASEANGGRRWSDEAVAAAWELTHGHPYLLQHLCWHVQTRAKGETGSEAREEEASRLRRCATCGHKSPDDSPRCATCGAETWQLVARSPPATTREDVEAAVPATLEAGRSILSRLWEDLPRGMRAVAWLLAKAGPGPMPEERLRRLFVERRLLEASRDPARASRSIEGWDLVEAVEGGYRLRVELLRRWIAALDPPEGALEVTEAALEAAAKHEAAARLGVEAEAVVLVGQVARAPQVMATPAVGVGEAGAAAVKRRSGWSLASRAGAAALAVAFAVLLGWMARDRFGATSTAPAGTAAPSAVSSVSGPGEVPGAPGADDDGKSLPPGRGYLVVDSPTESGVFAFSTFLGLTGRKLEVSCGSKFLRLGVPPADGATQPGRIVWTGPGKSAQVACKAVTHVSLTTTR